MVAAAAVWVTVNRNQPFRQEMVGQAVEEEALQAVMQETAGLAVAVAVAKQLLVEVQVCLVVKVGRSLRLMLVTVA
jgi:uncharacterized protein YidB (DUF937 family)